MTTLYAPNSSVFALNFEVYAISNIYFRKPKFLDLFNWTKKLATNFYKYKPPNFKKVEMS